MANNTIFDNVFRTMLEKMPELVVPLINEVFGTNYPADIAVEQQRNEHQTKQIENGRYKIYFPHSCVLYLRGKGRKDTLGMDIIMPDGRVIKYELPAIYIERYTQDVIFQKKLLFFLPFYVMRYEKSREDIEKDPEKLQKLLDEYVTISRRLEESLLE